MATQTLAQKRDTPESEADFPACITAEQRLTIEKTAVDFGINRRIMLSLLERSLEQLIHVDGEMTPQKVGEILIIMLDSIAEYEKHLADMQGMVKTAQARLIIAGQTMVDRGMLE